MKAEAEGYLQIARAQAATQPPPRDLRALRDFYRGAARQLVGLVEVPELARREWHWVESGGTRLRALLQDPGRDAEWPGAPPALVYFHGGGFAVGDLEAVEPTTAQLALESGHAVLSIDYRLAPEHPYPAAHEDACAALRWVRERASELGVDGARIAVGGDSAGASLALWAALGGGDDAPAPTALLLLYGWYDLALETASMQALAPEDPVIPLALMEAFRDAYLAGEGGQPGEIGFLEMELPPLPEACLIVGGRDPLRDDSELLAARLRQSGNSAELHVFGEMPHGFATVPFLTDARRAIQLAASFACSRARGPQPLPVASTDGERE